MFLRLFTVAGLLASAGIAGAQPAAAPRQTAQQMFDAADAAFDAGRYRVAADAFAALEARLAASAHPQQHSLAVARLRLGQSLFSLGDYPGATARFTAALPFLNAPDDAILKSAALEEYGRAEEASYDLTAAGAHYRQALALTPADDAKHRVLLTMVIARATLFDDPGAAADTLAAAMPDAERAFAGDKDAMGQYLALYGRALLNAHRMKPARAALKKALDLSGGLNLKVSLHQMTVRADAALAAAIDNDGEQAALYTAYTGAGRDEKNALRIPVDADPPPCGGAADIRPDDVAVVQFALGEDGAVAGAATVYASRAGPMAVAFAKAVAGWSWTPAEAAKIGPFFRASPRLEMRCTTKADRKSAYGLLAGEVRAWLVAEGGTDADAGDDGSETGERYAAKLPALRARLAGAEHVSGVQSPRVVPALHALARNPAVDGAERHAMAGRVSAIADAANAPLAVRAVFAAERSTASPEGNYYVLARRRARELGALADLPAYAAEPRVRAWLMLIAAEALAGTHDSTAARARLEAVVALPPGDLAAGDPVRQAASIRLASLQAAAGAKAAAAETFASSGLAANQCALLDATPQLVARSGSSADFPDRALALGFEGWAVTEFDIRSNGHTASPRAIIVYPPFLFGDASARIVGRSVYKPTFRPDGALSCGGYRDRVRYQQYGSS